jgi:hypothetical protein
MPDIKDRLEPTAPESRQGSEGPDLDALIGKAVGNGKLSELIAKACDAATQYFPPSHTDPGRTPHPGVRAAVRAFHARKHQKGRTMATDATGPTPGPGTPESVPLAYVGKWIAWSSDGMRIVAVSDTLDEVERLAHQAGEPDPIFHRPPPPHRL